MVLCGMIFAQEELPMNDYVFREDAPPPFPHQEKYLAESLDRPPYAVFWQQGTAKTRFVVDTASALYRERVCNGLLVLAPNRVHADDWAYDVETFTPNDVLERVRFHAYRTKSAKAAYHKRACEALLTHKGLSILTMSFEAFMTKLGNELAGEFLKRRLVTWVIDESGRMKSRSRMNALRKFRKLGVYRRILDGTPVSNSPFHVYNPVRFLDDDFWKRRGLGTMSKFKTHFGVWEKGYNGRTKREYPSFVKYKNMAELQSILEEIGSRVTKDVLGLPPKVYRPPSYFDLSADQTRVYDQLDEDMWSSLDGSIVNSEIVLTKTLRMREATSGYIREADTREVKYFKDNPRLETLRALTDELPNQAIVWCNFTPEVDSVCRMLGDAAARYDGTCTDDVKSVNKRAFKAGEKQFFVTTYKAAARGHNLQEASTVFEYSDTYDGEDKEQSEDRAHRSGQTKSVDYYTLTARGTAQTSSRDDDIRAARDRKLTLSQYLLDKQKHASLS